MNDPIAELRVRAGIPVDAHPIDPDPADTIAMLAEMAAENIDRLTPPKFHRPIPLDPRVADWIDAFVADPATSGSLMLAGGTGCGKTHNGWVAFRASVVGAYRRNIRPRYRAVTYPNFVAETRPSPNDAHVDALARYTDCDLLFMDDLGAEDRTSDWTNTVMFRLVNARWEQDRPTIWTTNRNATELTAALGDRVVSRIWDAKRVVLSGPDRRRVKA